MPSISMRPISILAPLPKYVMKSFVCTVIVAFFGLRFTANWIYFSDKSELLMDKIPKRLRIVSLLSSQLGSRVRSKL